MGRLHYIILRRKFYYNCQSFEGAVMETFDDITIGLSYRDRFFVYQGAFAQFFGQTFAEERKKMVFFAQ